MVAIRDTSSANGVTLASRVRVLGDDVDPAMSSASLYWMYWFANSGLPNASRWRRYSIVRSSPYAWNRTMYAAINRSSWNWDICCRNPRPISPTVFDTGTRTSSKTSSPVSEE